MLRSILVAWGVLSITLPGAVRADEFSEDFPDPLGGWTQRWLYQNSNLENYYVASGNCNIDNRGNNSCGVWIADTQGCGSGTGGTESVIRFKPEFGQTIQHLEFDLSAYSPLRMVIKDMSGNDLLVVDPVTATNNVCAGFKYSVDSNNGVASISLSDPQSRVEGWTAVDNVKVVTGGGRCNYVIKKSKAGGGCEACPRRGDNFTSEQTCEEIEDCRKKVKTTLNCPSGPGTCKIKGKRDSCR